jgi:hypothetical protein
VLLDFELIKNLKGECDDHFIKNVKIFHTGLPLLLNQAQDITAVIELIYILKSYKLTSTSNIYVCAQNNLQTKSGLKNVAAQT